MSNWDWLALALAAVLAGAINSVAGGGTLLTFPTLKGVLTPLGAGVEGAALAAVLANATSAVALVPGSLAGAWGYRTEIARLPAWTWWLAVPSFVGGLLGSLLLVKAPADVFQSLVPWLILGAALLFALQPRITRWTAARADAASEPNRDPAGDSAADPSGAAARATRSPDQRIWRL